MKITKNLNYFPSRRAFADDDPCKDNYQVWLCKEETEKMFPNITGKTSITLTVSNKRQHKKGEKKITLLRRGRKSIGEWDHIRYNGKEVFIAGVTGRTMVKAFNVPSGVDEVDFYVNITG